MSRGKNRFGERVCQFISEQVCEKDFVSRGIQRRERPTFPMAETKEGGSGLGFVG